MVIMDITNQQNLPIERSTFQKQLHVAIAQFGLVYPCLLKDRQVDIYKLYCTVWNLKCKKNGDYSYTNNVQDWRRIAEDLGFKGDINAIVLFKIYNRYVAEGFEKASSDLSGAGLQLKARPFKLVPHSSSPSSRNASPRSDCQDTAPRQKRVYRRRKEKNTSRSSTPVRATKVTKVTAPTRYSTAPIRYNIHANKSFTTCTRSTPASPSPRVASPLPTVVVQDSSLKTKLADPSPQPDDILPEGFVECGSGNDIYITDNGILPKPSGKPEKYDIHPVIRQLECGLPNEIQFGLNMLLMLSKTWSLPLAKYPRLVSVLLANTGIIEAADKMYWYDDGMGEFWEDTHNGNDFFNKDHKSQRTRAIQISTIFNNLCYIESNARLLLKNSKFTDYLVQSITSSCIRIRNLAVETLVNLSKQVEIEDALWFKDQVLQVLPEYLNSPDRYLVTSGLEGLKNLCLSSCNHLYVIEYLTQSHYLQVVQLLLVPDVLLLHSVLETIYTLTSIGVHPCERFLSQPHLFSTLVDLLSCTAERLEHKGIKVLRFVERKPVQSDQEQLALKSSLHEPITGKSEGTYKLSEHSPVKLKAYDLFGNSSPSNAAKKDMKTSANFARYWIEKYLNYSEGSILLKGSVYTKYLKAVTADSSSKQISPSDFFMLVSGMFPGSSRQKISVGNTMKFVVKNMDWKKGVIDTVKSNTPAGYSKIRPDSRPSTPMTQFSLSAKQSPVPARVKRNPLPLSSIADDTFKFVCDRKEDTYSDDEVEFKPKKRKRKYSKKVNPAAVVIENEEEILEAMIMEENENQQPKERAEIIVEDVKAQDMSPKIIEEEEDIDGRVTATAKSFDFPVTVQQTTKIVKTYHGVKRKVTTYTYQEQETKTNSLMDRFAPQQPREYSQYKKTLKLDLSSTPEKNREDNLAGAASPVDEKPSSPVFGTTSPCFDKPSSPVFCNANERYGSPTFDKVESPIFDQNNGKCSPTFDKAASPTFDKCGSPTFDKPAAPCSPTFDKPAAPSSPTFDKPAAPSSPIFDKPSSPTFDKPAAPCSPTFDKPAVDIENTEIKTLKKMKVEDDILVTEAVVDSIPRSSDSSTITYTGTKLLHSPQKLLNNAVSLVPISVASLTGGLNTPQHTPTPLRLAKISPHKQANLQYIAPNQPLQVLVHNQQQNVVFPQPGQQVLVMPQNSGHQRLLLSPQKQNKPVLLVPAQHQTSAQPMLVSSPQPVQLIPASQPSVLFATSQSTGQPIYLTQQPQPQPLILAPSGQQQILFKSPTQPQVMVSQPSNYHQSNGHVLVPASSGHVIISSQANPMLMTSSQPSARVLVIPQHNNQVFLSPHKHQIMIGTQTSPQTPDQQGMVINSSPVFLNQTPMVMTSQTSPTKQILVPLSSHGGRITPVSGFMTSQGGVLTSNVGVMTSQGGLMTSQGGLMTSQGGLMTAQGCLMTSQGGLMTSQCGLMTSQGCLVTSQGGLMTSQGGLMTSQGGIVTSCTTVYEEPVVCTSQNNASRFTVTMSPNKMYCPVKVSHISPIKIMTNGAGFSHNQGRVADVAGKRGLTKIAPKPHHAPDSETVCGAKADPSVNRKRRLQLPPSKHSHPCYWDKCELGFEGESDLTQHLMSKHVHASSTSCQWITCKEKPNTRSKFSLIFHLKNIHGRAPRLPYLPSCSYTSERLRHLLARPPPCLPPRETPITKSLHLLLALVIRNLMYFTPELVGDVTRYEPVFADVAMSGLQASRVMTDVLAMVSGITGEDNEEVFMTHLPPFR